MAWVTALVALGSAYAASQSGDSSATQNQGSLADLQSKIGNGQYRRYEQQYAPREAQLLNTVFDQGTTPAAEAARSGAEAAKAAEVANESADRNARRLGIDPNSPAYAALQRDEQANTAGLEAAASTYGRRYANDSNFSKQMGALGLGRNMVATASKSTSDAFDMYGNLAQQENQRDATTGKLYGNAAGSLYDAAKNKWGSPPATTTVNASNIKPTLNDYSRPALTDALAA